MDPSDGPSELPSDRFSQRDVVLSMNHDRAVEHVRDAVVEQGFDVPVQFSPSERINAKHVDEVPPYTVLGLGLPAAAAHALDAAGRRIGALFPCRIVVWEAEPGLQHVYHLNMMLLAQEVGLAPDTEALRALVDGISNMIDDAFAAMGEETDDELLGNDTDDGANDDGSGFRNE